MSPAEQVKHARELDQVLLAAEVHEEEIVCRLEHAGLEVDRRSDADPRAILGVNPSRIDHVKLRRVEHRAHQLAGLAAHLERDIQEKVAEIQDLQQRLLALGGSSSLVRAGSGHDSRR